jgi:hypothetical protein
MVLQAAQRVAGQKAAGRPLAERFHVEPLGQLLDLAGSLSAGLLLKKHQVGALRGNHPGAQVRCRLAPLAGPAIDMITHDP